MKALINLTMLFLAVGLTSTPIQAKKINRETTIQKMEQETQKTIKHMLRYTDVSKFLTDESKTTVFVNLRVNKDCEIEVLNVETDNEMLKEHVKSTISNKKICTDEVCRYRQFRVPLTFMIKN